MIRTLLLRALLVAVVAGLPLALAPAGAGAKGPPPSRDEIRAAELPVEARELLVRIRDGGPFRYDRDGVVFGNREHQLPSERRGYYHEYTVPTPGATNRGARRIVCGGSKTAPQACWYTGDHYRSFARIRE